MNAFLVFLFFAVLVLDPLEGKSTLGVWKGWGLWTDCSVTCGPGLRTRHRLCAVKTFAIRPRSHLPLCDGADSQKMQCHRVPCLDYETPIFYGRFGEWGLWCEWSLPDRTCGNFPTLVQRTRECSGAFCQGIDKETKYYRLRPCPINGNWGVWSSWSKPSKTCDQSEKVKRTRKCDNPSPAHGGRDCGGEDSQRKIVDLPPCPIDGGWSKWSQWSSVSETCQVPGAEEPVRGRGRSCDRPAPAHGGKPCVGRDLQSEKVILKPCPIDGGWSKWSQWLSVSETCQVAGGGEPLRRRGRSCKNPVPAHGGKPCVGRDQQSEKFVLKPCPIDGGWSAWSQWSAVARTCGLKDASRSRSRSCTQPSPAFGGRRCQGSPRDTSTVPLLPCPVDGVWSDWSAWSGLPITCSEEGVRRSRVRSCDHPPPSFRGRECQGEKSESRKEYLPKCETDGQWCDWSQWSKPSHKCGSGSVQRRRSCTQPPPSPRGKPCRGHSSESKRVTGPPCHY